MTYTGLMSDMTTIRVRQAVRDRLAAMAAEHGRSLGAELGAILDDLTWDAIAAGYRRMAPDELVEYRSEAEAWSALDLGDLAVSAAAEYPEYNEGGAP